MIIVSYNMEMPNECSTCPLFDYEEWFCHGHDNAPAWELTDYRYEGKPNWCPLIEVKMEKKKCRLCEELEPGDRLYQSSSWDGGIGFDYINDIQYCPVCGAKLITWDERCKLNREAHESEIEGDN